MITDMDIYLFDLQGYIHLEEALTQKEVDGLNACVNKIPSLSPGQWYGHIHGHTYGDKDGLNYQQIYEAGEPFEELIDHPSWLSHINCFVGGDDGLFIDESFADIRGHGQATRIHSGASKR